MLTALDSVADKAKIVVRGLPKPVQVGASAGDNDGKRNLTLLVSSPLFPDKKKCTCSVGSVEELTAALQQSLGLQGQRIGKPCPPSPFLRCLCRPPCPFPVPFPVLLGFTVES